MPNLKRIACVEDDPDIRAIIDLALGDLGGLDVTLFVNGLMALEGLEAAKPDLIVLDVMMPNMDGLETLARLREHSALQAVPAIFMTAKAQPSEIERFYAAGAIGVITKPFDPVSLADEIRSLYEDRPMRDARLA